jgi:tryptophanyl-tRNA synthetase
MEKMKVTPWEVSGEIDYDKLRREFGIGRIDDDMRYRMKKMCDGLHPMLARRFFFAQRDLKLILDDHESGKGFFLYTGRKPSKGMHIGHLVPLIFTKWLQEKFKTNLYIEITDDEGFLHKKERTWEGVQEAAKENILDIAAMGFDPQRTFIFKDSEYIKNIYPLLCRAARKITFSTVKAVFGFNDSTNIGISMYPAMQTIPATIYSKFLPPLQGVKGKMSSSAGAETAILLTDDEKKVKQKINKYAFSGGRATVEEHRLKGGNPDIDVPYQWLNILFEPDKKKLKQLHDDYIHGKLLTGEMKAHLIKRVNEFLAKHRENREKAKKQIDQFMYKGKLAKEMWGKTYE